MTLPQPLSHSAAVPEWLMQPLSHSARVAGAATQPLATLPEWPTQPLSHSATLPERLEEQPLRHSATQPLCRSGWRSHSATQPLCQSGWSSHSATQSLCQSGWSSHSATQSLCQSGWSSHSATQPLWVTEWLCGCVSHSARVAEWLSGWCENFRHCAFNLIISPGIVRASVPTKELAESPLSAPLSNLFVLLDQFWLECNKLLDNSDMVPFLGFGKNQMYLWRLWYWLETMHVLPLLLLDLPK